MPTTTRGALPYPGLTDDVDVPQDVQALADRLATIGAHYAQGTFALRPAAGTAGLWYEVTSGTNATYIYYDNGSSWTQVYPASSIDDGLVTDVKVAAGAAIDGDKIAAATATASISSIGAGFTDSTSSVRRDLASVGRLAGAIGNLSGSSKGAGSTVATIQAGFRPVVSGRYAASDYDNPGGGTTPASVVITSGGIILLGQALPNNHYICLDGITYAI